MVGERLAEIRKDHNDTQAVLAKKLNVSVTTVRSWEQRGVLLTLLRVTPHVIPESQMPDEILRIIF